MSQANMNVAQCPNMVRTFVVHSKGCLGTGGGAWVTMIVVR